MLAPSVRFAKSLGMSKVQGSRSQHLMPSVTFLCVRLCVRACMLQETLLVHERILLQTMKFELQMSHPYSSLMKYAKALIGMCRRSAGWVQTCMLRFDMCYAGRVFPPALN